MKYVVWAIAIVFALAVAFPVFVIAGFGAGLGPTSWSDQLVNGVLALSVGLASQLGFGAVPIVRARNAVWRAAATILMVPAFVLGAASYRPLFSRLGSDGARAEGDAVLVVFVVIVPVYLLAAWWLWRARAPRVPVEGTP